MPPKSARHDDAHEVRIQRLEDGLSEVKTSHAEVSVNLQALTRQVGDSARSINDKIDSAVLPLSQTLHDHIAQDTLSRVEIEKHAAALARIQEERDSKASSRRAWKAGFYTVFTGAAAIGMKELAMWLFHHL